MEYRALPHGGEKISMIGFGTSGIGGSLEKDAREAVAYAVENGVNYFDMAAGHAEAFPYVGAEISGCREKLYFQIHFGANYTTGKYGWTTDLDEIKRSLDWQLKNLRTDYIDFGFIHCIDELSDLEKVRKNGVVEYIKQLRKQGVVRHIGISTHTPEVGQAALDMGILDMMMFSINPGYDYQKGEYAVGSSSQRMDLYRRCEKEGVGISVMKAFSGGQLLDAKTSPFGQALTEYQCIQYALDKPGVVTVLPGIRNKADVEKVLGFCAAGEKEKDYSVIGSFVPRDDMGVCVYCNHCQPCPMGIDVGLVNKYYDLAMAGDILAVEHYKTLEKTASGCVKCGHCESRCPFHVKQESRMEQIAAHFGK